MFQVWGYTDESPEREVIIEHFENFEYAKVLFEVDGMATAVIDTDTDEVLLKREV
jgi:hypothetical protein